MANNKTSSEERSRIMKEYWATHEHNWLGKHHSEATKKKMTHSANERWKSQEQRRVQSENQKKALEKFGLEHFGIEEGKPFGTYERTPGHRAEMSKILKEKWQEPGRRGVRAAQQSKAIRKRYDTDPVFRAKNYEAAKTARSSEKFKEYVDKLKRGKEQRIREEMAFKEEQAETKYASQKMAEMQRRKYKEACRVLADYDISPLPNQSIEYYDQVIAYVKNMI